VFQVDPRITKLRGRVAESGDRHYQIAARAKIHPSRFSQLLNGRAPLSKATERRILGALGAAR
jgi:hypothetical protein